MYEDGEDSNLVELSPEYPTTAHTMATAKAMFRGNTAQAINILKTASGKHPELLFVSLALQLVGRGDRATAKEHLDFDEAVASKTDPYLRVSSASSPLAAAWSPAHAPVEGSTVPGGGGVCRVLKVETVDSRMVGTSSTNIWRSVLTSIS